MSKKLYFIIAAVLVGFYFSVSYTPSLNDAELAANKQASVDYLETNKSQQGLQMTESGLQYKVLQPGTGTVHPKETDQVTVHYEGSLIDGSVFDSSIKRDKPFSFPLENAIKGWKEGLPLMVVGDKTRFYIPPNLAYGEQWAGDIPPNSTLIFDIELLAINE